MRVTSEVQEVNGVEKWWRLNVDVSHLNGECQLFIDRNDYMDLGYNTWVNPTDTVEEWSENGTLYKVGDWTFVKFDELSDNFNLVIGNRTICQFRPSAVQLIITWTPRLAKTAELYKVGADLVITRENRITKINKFIPIKRLKIKSLLTQ